MPAASALGEFLRARRELTRPEDVGLPVDAGRRVPGLRREELAHLAGVSVDYYVRLERGTDRHPSPLVVGALARALRLDAQATAHLDELARLPLPGDPGSALPERVRPTVRHLVEAWDGRAAFVLGRHMDVLAHNALAEALHPGFVTGRNLMRFVFLDPRARARYVDWDEVAHDAVATLRASAGTDLGDPGLVALVGELSLRSEAFRTLWARHDVRDRITGTKRFEHPVAGRLELDYESFAVSASPGQWLVVYGAAPGSASADALVALIADASHSAAN